MENFIYVIIALAYLVYYLIRASNKKNQQGNRRPAPQRQRPANEQRGQSQQRQAPAPNRPSSAKNVFEILREEIEGRKAQETTYTETMEHDPFLEEERRSQAAHPARSNLKNERAQEREKDREHYSEERMVREFERTHSQGKTISHHAHGHFDPQTDAHKGRKQTARSKVHPMTKMLKGRKNIRRAIILKEILDRRV